MFKKDRALITLSPSTCAFDAIQLMKDQKIGAVVLTHNDQTIAGIVTERDLVTRLLAKNLNPHSTMLQSIMTPNVVTANEHDDLINWLSKMSQKHFRHLPIIDNKGKLKNILSQGDIVAYLWPDAHEKGRNHWLSGYIFPIIIAISCIIMINLALHQL